MANGRKTQRSVLLCALAAATVEPDKYGAGEKTLAIVTGENGPETTIITWGPEAEWLPRSELLRHLVQSMLGLTPAEPKVAVLDDDLGS
ncbi:MAG: hypothetical protein OXC01_15935 [Immundisolibacterales bacterium]|nr:hypothetical protein [Immundisolibacterales bacterium]